MVLLPCESVLIKRPASPQDTRVIVPTLHSPPQRENRLLVLCLTGHVVEVHCPNPKFLTPSKTFHLPELPRRSFRFRSIKSRLEVWACSAPPSQEEPSSFGPVL